MGSRVFQVWLLALVLAAHNLFAQVPNQSLIKKWNVKDGLSQGVVNSVIQDDLSLMWLATEDGLNRFDGYSFKIFRYNPDDRKSISDNFIQHLYRDNTGRLWVSSRKGLLQFDPSQEVFTLFRHEFADKDNYAFNDVSYISEGSAGNLWVAWYGSGFASFDTSSKVFTPYTPLTTPGLRGEKAVALHEDKFGLLWVGLQDAGVGVYQVSKGKVVKEVEVLSRNPIHSNQNIHAFAEDKWGNIWIATGSGLMVYQRETNQFYAFNTRNYPIAGMNLMSLFIDVDDNLWIGTQGSGLFQLDLRQINTRPLSDFIFTRIRHLNEWDISKRTIQTIYQDKDKNLWVGTFGDGVYLVSSVRQNFTKIQKAEYDNTAVSYTPYYGMCYDNEGVLWLGTDGNGIFRSDINGNIIRQYTKESTGGSLADNAVISAMKDHAGNLWFGTYSRGLFRYNAGSDKFQNYKYVGKDIYRSGGNDVRVIFQDSRRNIWIGTNRGGLCLLDQASGTYSNPKHFQGALADGDIRSITEDSEGNLWLGFYGDGVYSYTPATKKAKRHFSGNTEPLLKSDIVFAIKADEAGRIWVGTGGGGLCVYDTKRAKFRRYTEKDGLANNTIYALLIDKNENIWLTTNSGISKLDQNHEVFLNYDGSDGLQEGQFNPGSAMYNEIRGFMCMGGTHGVNIFYPDKIMNELPKPKVLLSGFSLFNKPVEINDSTDGKPVLAEVISRTREIHLAHDQNVLTFDFVGLNYSYPEKNVYSYKLDGLDDDWNYVGKERSATYRYLKPGDYEFKVKSNNGDNNWGNEYASVRVIIKPPLWKTTYAYALYVVAIAGLSWGAVVIRRKQMSLRRRLKIEKSQRRHERELVQQKLSFFTEISHEFKTPLTLMIGPLEELISSETNLSPNGRKLKMVYRNAHKLLNLINKLLDYRKIESGKVFLKVDEDDLVEFTREIYVTFKELANHKNIELEFHSDEPTLNVWFDKEKLEMVLNNIISNSFKYIGKGNKIRICLSKQISDKYPQGRAVIKIKDNGIGIPRKHLGNVFDWFHKGETSGTMSSGIGLALSKKLVHLHKGEIFVDSTEGAGSVFSIKIPIGKEYFKPEEILPQEDKLAVAIEQEKHIFADVSGEPNHRKGLKSILLIEDDEEIRMFLREYFEKEYKIMEASNGREGLESANQHHPDLIVSDVMMPEMDGIEFCKEIKTNMRTSHIPVILLTAKSSLTHHKEGIQIGADAYITKPFSPEILSLTVHNLLHSRENLKRFYRNLFTQESGSAQNKEVNVLDEKFLHSIYDMLKANLDKPDFNINELCDELHMSRSLVYKKVKMLTGLSPVEYIRSLRMQEAARLLKTRQYKVFEVVYMVGFSDLKYFRQCFTKEFGYSPSDFIRQAQGAE